MAEPQTCAGCETPLLEGVPDVFCPACALRRALTLGGSLVAEGSASSIDPEHLESYKQGTSEVPDRHTRTGKGAEINLASPHACARQSANMSMIALVAGDVLGDYEIIENIGGNMGLVFKARHRLLDKIVALKLFPVASIVDARFARFQNEIRLMGRLAHENLVTAVDARSVPPWHLVAMEWIDGRDLQQLVRTEGSLPVDLACEAVRQAALGLDYAHRHNLIHRDIKPSNLMLTNSGAIKVIDLGLARTADDNTAHLTQAGHVLGTMPYCSPEQLSDASKVDNRADIYSLGCTLYHLLSGNPPYYDRKSVAEFIHAHQNQPFPTVSESRADVPQRLETVIHRMTAKDPDSRFHSAGEVVDALEPFARGSNLARLLVPNSRQGSARWIPVEAPRPAVTPPEAPLRAEPRKRIWPGTAAVALLLLTIAAGIFAWKSAQPNPVVVLMDTTAPGGVYEKETRDRGGTNAEELYQLLHEILPNNLEQVAISSTWAGEAQVLAKHPRLLIIHRSSFFHTWNAELNFGSPPFTNHIDQAKNREDDARWHTLYRLGDDRLRGFVGLVGTVEPQTKFLIYSRGTDVRWRDPDFRENWKKHLEDRFPKLKGRIKTMLIRGEQAGSFKIRENADEMREKVIEILGLSKKSGND